MRKIKLTKFLPLAILLFSALYLNSQTNESAESRSFKSEIRGKNVVSLGLGSSIMNGDYEDPKFEIYGHIGYKRAITSHLNINFGYHKFNLAYKEVFNEGFMSFDANLEWLFTPDNNFTPFLYGGGGLNASNYFNQTDAKVQVGGGIEYLFTDNLGLKLYADYNYLFVDTIDGLIAGNSDDVYWRMAVGLKIYFGNGKRKTKVKSNEPTIINSNPIIEYKN